MRLATQTIGTMVRTSTILIVCTSLWSCTSTTTTQPVRKEDQSNFELEASPTATQAFRISVEPRGRAGWTGDIPVVSPQGDRMVVVDPDQPTDLLIRSIPNNRLDDPAVLARIPGPIDFGRSVDETGFAVMDGERVGRAAWVGGFIEWFSEKGAKDVDLGPDARVAWIQNGALVIRTEQATLSLQDEDATWHGPRWQGPDGTLFCWRIRDGALDLVRFRTNVSDADALRRTALPLRIAATGGSAATVATTSTFRQFDATQPGPPRCVFWDPARKRVRLWEPPYPVFDFPSGVLAFVTDPNDPRFGMAVQSTVLRRISLLTPDSGVPISGGLRLPCPIPNKQWLLFAPGDKQINVECAILQPLSDNNR
ncbi:MAG: hypothetical protein CMJ28_02225 [Phycisphaerae bacterium]|nr:hypothetical protein [Phycisphaerae bacterium]